jgi:hypothetical protein
MASPPPPAPPSTPKHDKPKKVGGPLYRSDSCPAHVHQGWRQLVACGHHRGCLEIVLAALDGRIIPAAGASVQCGVLGIRGLCGCRGDLILLTGAGHREIVARYGRVPVAAVEWAARRSAEEPGRDPVDWLSIIDEVRAWAGGSWIEALRTVQHFGSLSGLRLALSPPDGQRMAVSTKARAVARRISGALS